MHKQSNLDAAKLRCVMHVVHTETSQTDLPGYGSTMLNLCDSRCLQNVILHDLEMPEGVPVLYGRRQRSDPSDIGDGDRRRSTNRRQRSEPSDTGDRRRSTNQRHIGTLIE